MYLHIGQDIVVRQRDIVGIFDMENTTISRYTRQYLRQAEQDSRVVYVSMELPKSFVVYSPAKGRKSRDAAPRDTVYISQISPRTLHKRNGIG